MPNNFEIHAQMYKVMARKNQDGRMHIHQTEVVTTVSLTASGLDKKYREFVKMAVFDWIIMLVRLKVKF